MKRFPVLQEIGIGLTTLRYLFKPGKKGTHSAERYKSVINAKVPQKDNSSPPPKMGIICSAELK